MGLTLDGLRVIDADPSCLYPKPLEAVDENMSTLAPSVQRKILGENAAKRYRI